jgi:hypothetical protein
MLAAFLMPLLVAASEPAPIPAFLAGCWEERRADGGWTEECWIGARGGLMLGAARDGKAEKVGHWEWMRVERSPEGKLTFYASPKGAPAVSFTATEVTGDSVTFVNETNDYPQRVRYSRSGDTMNAEISLKDGSKPNRWRYRLSGTAKGN